MEKIAAGQIKMRAKHWCSVEIVVAVAIMIVVDGEWERTTLDLNWMIVINQDASCSITGFGFITGLRIGDVAAVILLIILENLQTLCLFTMETSYFIIGFIVISYK